MRVRIEPVDRIGCPGQQVVPQRQVLQVTEQPRPQAIHEALSSVDLHLRLDHAQQFAGKLQQHAGDDNDDQQPDRTGTAERRHESGGAFGQRHRAEHVVDDDFQRPRGQRGDSNLGQRQDGDCQHARPVRSEEREGPADHRPPTLRRACVRRSG
jgi:hypothetical protein